MHLRKAGIDDHRYLHEWLHHHEDCMNTTNKSTLEFEDFAGWLKADDQWCYILESEGKAIGYGEIWVDDEERDIEFAHLVISPTHRLQGFGRKLVTLLEGEAQRIHYPWIYIRVTPENEIAQNSYRNAGFKEDSSLRDIFDGKWVWLKKENIW